MEPIPSLAKYLADIGSPDAREDFARRCGTTVGQLKQVAGGHRRCGEKLAVNIDRETGGLIPCEVLRPDVDWAYLRGRAAIAEWTSLDDVLGELGSVIRDDERQRLVVAMQRGPQHLIREIQALEHPTDVRATLLAAAESADEKARAA